MLWALRLTTLAGALVGLWDYSVFLPDYPDHKLLFGLWAVAPFPLAYALARRLAPGPRASKIVLAGLVVALVLATWTYADAVAAYRDGTESLSGLVVIFGPVWQYAVIAPFLLAAWIVNRRGRSGPPRDLR